jgi:deoxyribodipyrimidine photolyase-related protein
VDRHLGEKQAQGNAWGNHGRLTEHWYDGSTGIPPLDDAIQQAQRMGWTHHIQRLMVIANLMNLAGIAPREVYRWFMETHIDSADWVMGPNVYGMGLASDGGLMVTKPYVCGSNYLLKMSDYERGPWCDVVDGLYWRFVDRHRETFASNPRLAVMPRSLDRLKDERKQRIFAAADEFVQEYVA